MEKIKIPKEFWEDAKWAEEHYSELIKKYPEEWIAIVDKKVVSRGENLALVREEARAKTGRERIPTIFVECGDHVY